MTESAAKSALEGVGLKLGSAGTPVVAQNSNQIPGTIATQDKTGSTDKGSVINYTLYTASSPSVNP